MSHDLHPVWQQVELLLNDGINLVPVRDHDENINGRIFKAKTPYAKWEQYKTIQIDRQDLFHQMEAHNTTAVAMVCGAISGNLEGIDIDEKYLPGISARFFSDLKELYPDIYEKLRVHKTPSGGCHIPYRIEPGHEVPASQQLAKRVATEDELAQKPNGSISRCFIESKGTGGLMTCPPSMGYSVRRDRPIPVLTWVERCTLIEFCKSYNTYIKLEKPYKPNKAEVDYYDENPFEHYNRTCDPQALLENFGWKLVANRGGYLWFTRPDGKRGDVHGSFNVQDRYYYIFSPNAGLDNERAYNPATLLAHYQFNDDKQKTYQWLVQNGFGRIKQNVEQRIARRAALTGNELPANISEVGRQLHTQVVEQLNEQHPHGIFWEADEKDKIVISRERLYSVAAALGFRWAKQTAEIVQIVDIFIYKRDERFFYDILKEYIHETDGDLLEDICNSFEAFIEKHGKFTTGRLPILATDKILIDTREVCYKYYQNGCVMITKDRIDHVPYDQLVDYLIWADKIQWRDYIENNDGGLYVDFLNNAVQLDKNRSHVMRSIGYLAHDYKDETTGYIIVLTEQCADPKQGGGTGKNMFCDLFSLCTTYGSVPGSQAQFNEKFLQSWQGERLFGISDVDEKFNYRFLKELSTGSAIVKKLFKNDTRFGVKDMPKFIIHTNFSFDISDGGLKRRIIFIEFTTFFTQCNGVRSHYGKHFPNDWSTEDYTAYDTFICQCVQLWLQSDLQLGNSTMSETGWEKQFIQNYGDLTYDFINEYKDFFIKKEDIFNYEIQKAYDEFMNLKNSFNYRIKFRKLNSAMDEYYNHFGYDYFKDKSMRNEITGKTEKCVKIRSKEPPF